MRNGITATDGMGAERGRISKNQVAVAIGTEARLIRKTGLSHGICLTGRETAIREAKANSAVVHRCEGGAEGR